MEDLSRRLLVGGKNYGRGVYDEGAKAELVAACGKPGASVSRLARQCGINANQLSRWVREHSERRQRSVVTDSGTAREVFVAIPVAAPTPTSLTVPAAEESQQTARMNPRERRSESALF